MFSGQFFPNQPIQFGQWRHPRAGKDPYYSLVSLLLHCDGADTTTTFTDNSPIGHTATALGNAQVDTAQSKFGGASCLMDGTGDGVRFADHASFELGADDFTIEAWVRFANVGAVRNLLTKFNTTGDQRSWLVQFQNVAVALRITYSTDGAAGTTASKDFAWSPSIDTWYHVALVRVAGDLMAFIDGTQIGTTQSISGVTFFDGTANCVVGMNDNNGGPMNGWMDDVRLTKGLARYTANFTPHVAAHPDS